MAKQCGSESKCNCYDNNTVASGNAIDIRVDNCQSEIRADILVEEYKSVRIWGQVINCQGYPVAGALVKLVKIVAHKDGYVYKGIAHTRTDCDGFYQFDICDVEECKDYKVIVSKPDYGPERVVFNPEGNCNACEECNPEPCAPEPCAPKKQKPGKEYPPMEDHKWRNENDKFNYGYNCGCN